MSSNIPKTVDAADKLRRRESGVSLFKIKQQKSSRRASVPSMPRASRMKSLRQSESSGHITAETFPLCEEDGYHVITCPAEECDDDDLSTLGEPGTSLTKSKGQHNDTVKSRFPSQDNKAGRKTTAKLFEALSKMQEKLHEIEERNAELERQLQRSCKVANSAVSETEILEGLNRKLAAQVEDKTQAIVRLECRYEELEESFHDIKEGGASTSSSDKELLLRRIAELEAENRLLRSPRWR